MANAMGMYTEDASLWSATHFLAISNFWQQVVCKRMDGEPLMPDSAPYSPANVCQDFTVLRQVSLSRTIEQSRT